MNLFAVAATESGGSNAFTDFMTREVGLGSGVTFAYWHILVAIVVLVALIAVIAVVASKAAKKGKRQRVEAEETIDVSSEETPKAAEEKEEVKADDKAEEREEILAANSDSAIMEDEQTNEETEAEETAVEPVEAVEEEPATEEPVAEPVEEIAEEPVKEVAPAVEAETEVKAEEAVKEEKKEEKPVRAKKPAAPRKTVKAVVKEDAEEKKEEKPVATQNDIFNKKVNPLGKSADSVAVEVAAASAEEKEEVAETKLVGKFEICNSDLGGYNYLLRASNGQLLYESKAYKSVESCREAINNFVEAVKAGMFTVRADKFNHYKFILKSPTSNTLLYVGESLATENSCRNNIESVKRFALVSPVVDITDAEFVAKFNKYEIPEEVVKAVEEGTGATGKWEIAKVNESVKTSPFVYLLYANNGQLLYESRDYKTYNSCLGGLKTFINTVKNGSFVVDPDKSGRYKFVLRSQSANSPMEYYGQSYGAKSECESNIESVYRFALRSPLPETQK